MRPRVNLTALSAAAVLSFSVLLTPSQAQAQCENSFTATSTFNQMAQDIASDLNDFIEQEQNFIDDKITETATNEVLERLDEFDRNIRAGLSEWWREHYLPTMRLMTQQLHVAQIDQSRVMGAMLDAKVQNEYMQAVQVRETEARRRYEPNEMTCQVDSVAHGQTKAAKMSRAVSRAMATSDQPRRLNAEGTPAAQGKGAEQKVKWDEYVTRFCDPDKGGQGCAAAGSQAGLHVDIPALLWSDKQTIDMTSPDNQALTEAAMKYLIAPSADDPIPEAVLASPQGQEAFLMRRSKTARTNAIYNVVGQMLSERVGGSGVNTQDIRVASGLPPADASTDASYREIVSAVSKDRFHNPQYIVNLVSNPEQVVREQGAVNVVRLQQLNDLYKRLEEMVFMEAAVYASELDQNVPKVELRAMPTRP